MSQMIVENTKLKSALLLLKRKALSQMTSSKKTCFLTEEEINEVLSIAEMEIEPAKEELEVIDVKELRGTEAD